LYKRFSGIGWSFGTNSLAPHREPGGKTIQPNDSDPIRRSVEVEYWVIDGRGRLTAPGDLRDCLGAEGEFVKPILEVKTTPCETTAELRAELLERIGRVVERARRADKRLVPLGTPLSAGSVEDRPSERTRIQDRVIGDQFDYVRHCAGTHVHVEQRAGAAVDQLNTLVALDPALALVNSSPYHDGERLAAGARSKLYRWLAYERQPQQGRLWPYVDDTAEWGRRLDRRYEEFVTEAVMSELDRDRVESCFDPESAIWTPVQLRAAFSTVEWRSPDTALPSQIVRLADDIVSVAERATTTEVHIEGTEGRVGDEALVLPEFDAVRSYVEAAIHDGIENDEVRSYLKRMGFDVDAYEPMSETIDDSAQISRERARELRLAAAERLEQDVRQARVIDAD